jgi:hypothetical protein
VKAAAGQDKKVTLLVDVAYIDFAGDGVEYRKFMPKLENLPKNISLECFCGDFVAAKTLQKESY